MDGVRDELNKDADTFYDQGYRVWKSWGRTFEPTAHDCRYFLGEFSDVSLSGARVLEVGFGSGAFMAWAQGQGARVSGCELIKELCDEGRSKGFDTRYGSLENFEEESGSFDLIVAMDVLEHIQASELPDFLLQVKKLLRPGGVLISRTPNGASPWGLIYQNGDISHVTRLSPGVYEQLSLGAGLRLESCRNAFRVVDPAHPFKDWLRYRLRDLLDRGFSFAYGLSGAPLDANILAVLRRPLKSS